nr:hypothetical protein [Cylindrospermum sp. FACHB-282]
MDINLRGVFLCMKHEIPLIFKQGRGAMARSARWKRFGRGCLRRWARHDHRRRPNGAVMFVANTIKP